MKFNFRRPVEYLNMEMAIITKNDNDLISTAVSWAESIWKEASLNWVFRSGQDLNFRNYIIHPFLEKTLSEILGNNPAHILELGCGDGILLDSPGIKALTEVKGSYTGVDTSEVLLDKAEKNHNGSSLKFVETNLSNEEAYRIISQQNSGWNCIISVFVIQEVANVKAFIKNIAGLMSESVFTVIVTVHPDFAAWLMREKKMDENSELRSSENCLDSQWKWAGRYPIVDENHGTFFLPYFHREISDYSDLFRSEGLEIFKIVELPSRENIKSLVEKKISPFVSFNGNDYWPEMGVNSSAIAFIIRKEKNFEQ